MEYFERMQKTINYIEENIYNEITLENLAAVSCYSPYHFHRVFQALTGITVMDYIRRRRISEAAEKLKTTNNTIIEIAFLFQFNAHDSFTRAFKRYYGVTQGVYRKSNKINLYKLKKIIIPDKIDLSLNRSVIMEHKIISKESFKVMGYELRTTTINGENLKNIPEFWNYYMKNKLSEKIQGKKNGLVELGICCDFDSKTAEMSYIIGFEVDDNAKLQKGQVMKTIPASRYAVFTSPKADSNDFPKSIQETEKKIYKEWLPDSKYQYNDKGVEMEWYDERCRSKKDCRMDIYIPVK